MPLRELIRSAVSSGSTAAGTACHNPRVGRLPDWTDFMRRPHIHIPRTCWGAETARDGKKNASPISRRGSVLCEMNGSVLLLVAVTGWTEGRMEEPWLDVNKTRSTIYRCRTQSASGVGCAKCRESGTFDLFFAEPD